MMVKEEKQPRINKALSIMNLHDQLFNKKIPFAVHMYDNRDQDNGRLSAVELFSNPNYKEYYYRVEPYLDTPREIVKTDYFGVSVANVGSNSFDLGIYSNHLLNDCISFYSGAEELVETMCCNLGFHNQALRKIAELDISSFQAELALFLDKYPIFTEIDDIRTVQNHKGLYIMVLDDYASCYIGQSKNIKQRIQQHWRRTNFCTTGIDMFKAHDTTRIFAVCVDESVKQRQIDKLEYLFIHSIDSKYLLNCFGGGGSIEFIHSDSTSLGYRCDPI